MRSPVAIKHGVNVEGLKAPMLHAWQWYKRLYLLTGNEPVITDGVSPRNQYSLHPLGYAIDVRLRDLMGGNIERINLFQKTLQEILTDDYDVILFYQSGVPYLHIEYQRHIDDEQLLHLETIDVD